MTLIFNISLLILTILFLGFWAKRKFKIVFLYGLLVFQALTIIPSLIYIEEGIFISEQGRESYFVWATLLFVLYFVLTFIILFLTIGALNKVKPVVPVFKSEGKIIDCQIVYYIVVFVLIILLINASLSKLPLLDDSVTRFTYWSNSKFPFLNKILGNTSIFIPFALGALYKDNKKKSVFLMLVYFGYNFLIGQKFSPIVSGLFSFFLPIVLMNKKKINFRKMFNKKVIIGFFLLFFVVYNVIYNIYERRRPYAVIKIYDPNEAMLYRAFGLQGHLMWGATETYVYNNEPHSYNPLDLLYGMHHLMYKFAVKGKGFADAIESGFNFTNAYPSILLYVFPLWVGLIVHCLFTIIFLGFLGWLLKEFVINKALVMALITYQLFNWSIYAFTMGYFYKLKYPLIFIVCYGLFVVMRRTRKKIRNKIVD